MTVPLDPVATGPGVRELYWPMARPYQATSPVDNRRAIGISGAVWVDGDGDGKRSSAFDYARRLLQAAGADAPKLVASLSDYDEAVAVQARAAPATPRTSRVRSPPRIPAILSDQAIRALDEEAR